MNHKKTKIQLYSPYFFITLLNFLWFIFGLGKAESRLLKLDQKIMLLTSSKMHYFDINTFEAAWNHHTSPIFYLFKLVFIFSDFLNIDFGFYVLYSLLLLLISLLLFNICYKLTSKKLISILLSLAYIYDLSSTTLSGNILFDNRTIGMMFQCLIIIFAHKLLSNQSKRHTIFFTVSAFLQIIFLESYLVSCGLLTIYVFYKLEKKTEFIKYFLLTNLSLLTTSAFILWKKNELVENIFLNYQFHFDSIGFGPSNKISILELSKFGLFYHWPHNRFSHFVTIIFIAIFFFLKNKLKIKKDSKEMFSLIIVFFFSETLHLFLTGPRFTNYLQIILILQYLIIFIFVFYILSSFINLDFIKNFTMFALLLIMFFFYQFGDVVYARTSILDQSYLVAKQNIVQDSKVSKFLFEEGDPKLILTWISNESWDDIYFKSNKLPATRMWWWFEMKYVENIYQWKNNRFYNTNLEEIFIKDLSIQKPQYAVLETAYKKPPEFFTEYLEKNYLLIKKIDKFNIYQLNS